MVYLIHLYFLKTSPPKIIVPCKQKIVNYKFLYQLFKSLIIDDFMMDGHSNIEAPIPRGVNLRIDFEKMNVSDTFIFYRMYFEKLLESDVKMMST